MDTSHGSGELVNSFIEQNVVLTTNEQTANIHPNNQDTFLHSSVESDEKSREVQQENNSDKSDEKPQEVQLEHENGSNEKSQEVQQELINPYAADQFFGQIQWLPRLTKVLLSNFIGTLPTVTNVTELTFSYIHCQM